jgi:hypothetical protein
MHDYPPTTTERAGLHKENPIRLVNLQWHALPEDERVYISAFAKASGKQAANWQNPFGKGKRKHYLEDFAQGEDPVTMVLRTARGR